MTTDGADWRSFLAGYNREILRTEDVRRSLPDDVVAAEWLGRPGADEAELVAAEQRLQVQLPPSYRSFLTTSNGWLMPSFFVYELWPAAQITWFRDRHQDWIDAYAGPGNDSPRLSDEDYLVYGEQQDSVQFRHEYLQTALQISAVGDDAVMLLNPHIKTSSGEWEAWSFANWLPGATRFRTFYEMMANERASFNRLKTDNA